MLVGLAAAVSGCAREPERVQPAPVPDRVSEARWIYCGPEDDFPTSVCARLAFEIDRPVRRAWFHSFRERGTGVWLNGTPLNCTLWPEFKSMRGHVRGTGADITKRVVPGKNVLAFKLGYRRNLKRPDRSHTCGIILRGAVEFEDGKVLQLVSTPEQIKVSATEPAGWREIAFDDSDWQPGFDNGDATMIPWARYSDVMRQYATESEYAAYQEFLRTGGGAFPEAKLRAEPDSPNAKVVFSGRLPGIETNGKVIPPYAFMEIGLTPSARNDAIVRHASERGIHLFGLDRFLRGKYEAEDGTYDFRQFDGGIRRILAVDPEARFLLYYRNGAQMPVGWVEKHPDELAGYAVAAPGRKDIGDYSGNPDVPSFASRLYRDEERRFWKAFGDYVRQQPWGRRIIGIHCGYGGSGDGMPAGANKMPDTGKRMTEAFRRFLQAKYPTDAALQAAWGVPTVTRQTAGVPAARERMGSGLFVQDLADPRDRMVADYYDCYTRELESFMIEFAQSIKAALPGCLAGAYFGYTILAYSPEGNTSRIDRLLQCPEFDYFYCTSLGYNLTCGIPRCLPELCRRYGKFCSVEGDVRPHTAIGYGGEQQWCCRTPAETRATFGKFVANALVSGLGWQAVDFGQAQSGLGMWWHDCPEALETMGAGVAEWHRRWRQGASDESANEVAVVFDMDSPWRDGHADRDLTEVMVHNLVNYPLQTLNLSGYPWDLLSVDGYAKSPHPYRAVVFLNTLAASPELRAAARKARGERATAVWCYAPGLRGPTGYCQPEMEAMTGLRFGIRREPCVFTAVGPELKLSRFQTPNKFVDAPRLFVTDSEARATSRWQDDGTVASAEKRLADGSTAVFFGMTPHEPEVWARIFAAAGCTPVTTNGFYVARHGELLEVFSGKGGLLHYGVNAQRGKLSQAGEVEVRYGDGASTVTDVFSGERYPVVDGQVQLKSELPRTWLLRP